jgi:hypothetical protein
MMVNLCIAVGFSRRIANIPPTPTWTLVHAFGLTGPYYATPTGLKGMVDKLATDIPPLCGFHQFQCNGEI